MLIAAVLLAWIAGTVAAVGWALSVPGHRGAASDHFDGRVFANVGAVHPTRAWKVLKWIATRQRGRWRLTTEPAYGPPPPQEVPGARLRVTLVGHATVLIQTGGLSILTDPVWADRCSPVTWAGPRRMRPPGLRFEDLPPIDAVLLSHNHYDHLDVATLRRLAREHRPRFLVPSGNAAYLASEGIAGAEDLDWWQSTALGSLNVTAVPAQHFSGRGLFDRNRTLWCGFVVQGEGGRVYFAGDTGHGPFLDQLAAKFAPLRLALLPIGAYEPRWFMSPVHMAPDEAVRAHEQLAARTSVGIHYGTFQLADDGELEGAERLRAIVSAAPEPRPRFLLLPFGEGTEVE